MAECRTALLRSANLLVSIYFILAGDGMAQWIKDNLTGIASVIIFIIVLIGLAVLLNGIIGQFSTGTYSLSALALGGVIALLAALLVFTTLIHAIGLSSKEQALGLPEGSVRALIALALLGLFAILVSSVLNLKPELRTYSGLREGDITALIQHNPDARDIVQRQEGDSQPPTFKVEFYSAPRQDDFAKQMLTLVGTLMTAVISFYFGTTAVGSTVDSTQRSSANAVIPQVSPNAGSPNTPIDFTITGSGLAGVTQVEAVGSPGTTPVPATNVIAVDDTRVTCRLSLPAGTYTVRIRAGTSAPVDASPQINIS
jgi:hypothetical protein